MVYRWAMTMTRAPIRERILDTAEGLVLEQGFSATTVDEILKGAEASKGAFFHHFPSKEALGTALLSRYYERDIETLEHFMGQAEAASDDPAQQLLVFFRLFEESAEPSVDESPGCLYVSFVYERMPQLEDEDDVIRGSIAVWRARILEKLEAAAMTRPRLAAQDLTALADLAFVYFEGAYILVRATGDSRHLRRQLGLLRSYMQLLLEA